MMFALIVSHLKNATVSFDLINHSCKTLLVTCFNIVMFISKPIAQAINTVNFQSAFCSWFGKTTCSSMFLHIKQY